ncbi:MAG: hypothetical protein AB8H47_02400 [Bacteroidia bacterium]
MKFSMFNASIESILLRFVLLMALVIGGVLIKQLWVVLLSFPVLATALLGLKIEFKPMRKTSASAQAMSKTSSLVS